MLRAAEALPEALRFKHLSTFKHIQAPLQILCANKVVVRKKDQMLGCMALAEALQLPAHKEHLRRPGTSSSKVSLVYSEEASKTPQER